MKKRGKAVEDEKQEEEAKKEVGHLSDLNSRAQSHLDRICLLNGGTVRNTIHLSRIDEKLPFLGKLEVFTSSRPAFSLVSIFWEVPLKRKGRPENLQVSTRIVRVWEITVQFLLCPSHSSKRICHKPQRHTPWSQQGYHGQMINRWYYQKDWNDWRKLLRKRKVAESMRAAVLTKCKIQSRERRNQTSGDDHLRWKHSTRERPLQDFSRLGSYSEEWSLNQFLCLCLILLQIFLYFCQENHRMVMLMQNNFLFDRLLVLSDFLRNSTMTIPTQ